MLNLLGYQESKTKKIKRSEIIEKAKNLFIKEGIHPVRMSDISNEVDITVRTLYYYYKNKDDLAIDIQIIEMNNLLGKTTFQYQKDKTGYENLELMLNNLLTQFLSNQKSIKYITAFDYYFYNGYPHDKYSDFLNENMAFYDFKNLIEKGILDGTIIDTKEDSKILMDTIFQSFFAYTQKIIYREKSFIEAGHKNERGDLQIFLNMVLRSLKKEEVKK